MTIISLAIINCAVVELLLQVFALVYVSYGEQPCITNNFERRKQCNSTTISADDNQGNDSAQSQLVNVFADTMTVLNDTHVRDHANPGELLWEFTVCQGAPRYLLSRSASLFTTAC
jgi:hypothetical protein